MEIDKNIPMPKPREIYPIKNMIVGDSILIPDRSNASSSLRRYRKLGWKFATRKENDKTRLWRIK